MKNHLPPPWIAFPDLRPDGGPKQKAGEQLREWYLFLGGLTVDELLQYEQEHRPPPGWEWFYEAASQRLKRREQSALVAKMWRITTLK